MPMQLLRCNDFREAGTASAVGFDRGFPVSSLEYVNMSNATFAKSVDAFRSAEKSATNAFGTLSSYAVEILTLTRMEQPEAKDEVLANVLKNSVTIDENAYKGEKKLTEMPVAYRSAKSVLLAAVLHGVALLDEAGKPVGKSALEKAVKEAKGDSGKTELAKFTSTMATAYAIFAKVDTLHDIQQCKALVVELANSILKAEAERLPKAA